MESDKEGFYLHAMLFNLYVDDLSSLMSSSKVGCIFGDQVIINHIYYADDLHGSFLSVQ